MAVERGLRARLSRFFASWAGMVAAGLAIGVAAAVLQRLGNPPNMGLCIACFERDIAGAIGLHRFAPAQCVRPEIVGLVLGAMLSAFTFREFRPRGGAAPIVQFGLGVFAMIGALVFLGCPWRAPLRLAGGDGTAIAGLLGLAAGVSLGAWFMRAGYSLGPAHHAPAFAALLLPLALAFLLAAAIVIGPGEALFTSEVRPGSMRAPWLLALGAGALVGVLAHRSRFCTIGWVRKALFLREFELLAAVAALVVGAYLANACFGQFRVGMAGTPLAHSDHLWNFLSMVLVGLAYTLAGGCPGRQLVLAGEGDGDAAVFVCGMLVGAGVGHNFLLAAGPDSLEGTLLAVGGPPYSGKIAVVVGILLCIVLGLTARVRAAARTEGMA